MIRVGSWAGIAATAGFVVVYSWLAVAFDYPDVLDRPPEVVLPALRAGGQLLRTVWFAYALLPVLVVVAAVGQAARFERFGLGPPVLAAGLLASGATLLGLARWPTFVWALAHADLPPALAHALFLGIDALLGQFVGELVGEWMFAAWIALTAVGARAEGRPWLGALCAVCGAAVVVGSLRNAVPALDALAPVTAMALPVWLVAISWPQLAHTTNASSTTSTVR